MNYFYNRLDPDIVELLKNGSVGVLRTDTLYGIVASAANHSAVERVYAARKRDKGKASIILIADESQLLSPVPEHAKTILRDNWPGPVSIILPVDASVPEWLHRGTGGLAYRVPDDEQLREFLSKTGPLIAPSANLEGQPPARSVAEAVHYFGDSVDFYVDGGICKNIQPSKLIRVEPGGEVVQLR